MATAISSLDPPWGGHSKHGADRNDRTIPVWMDRHGMHGQRIILSLRAAEGENLPENPFILSKSINQVCGGNVEAANTEEKDTKYVLTTRSVNQAQKLLKMKQLIDGTKVEVVLHPKLNVRNCVITCRAAIKMTEENLLEELAPQGISKVRRITRYENGQKVNTATLVLTVNGTVVPEYINVGLLRVPTRLFYPAPMLCFNCYSYGHTKMRCQNTPVCKVCSGTHTLGKDVSCTQQPACKNCKDSHSPASKKCPLYMKEKEIIKIKVESGVSFAEARKEYQRMHGDRSYSAVTGAQARIQDIRKENEKDVEIRKLKEELANLKEVMSQKSEKEKEDETVKLREEVIQLRKIIDDFKNGPAKQQMDTEERNEFSISEEEMSNAESQSVNNDNESEGYAPVAKAVRRKSKRTLAKSVKTVREKEGDDTDRSRSSRSGHEPINKEKSNSSQKKRGRPPKHRDDQ